MSEVVVRPFISILCIDAGVEIWYGILVVISAEYSKYEDEVTDARAQLARTNLPGQLCRFEDLEKWRLKS